MNHKTRPPEFGPLPPPPPRRRLPCLAPRGLGADAASSSPRDYLKRPPQRTPLARVLPPCRGCCCRHCRAARSRRATPRTAPQRAAHRAGRGARRDRGRRARPAPRTSWPRMRRRVRGRRRAGRGAALQLARRQPGAGRHHQRRNPAPEDPAQEEGRTRWSRRPALPGAYYIAVAADEIYADKASIVGSIGVLMDGFGFTGTMEKLGVERRLLTAGENKGIGDPFSPVTEKQRAYTPGDARPDPPAVHRRGEAGPRPAPEGKARTPSRACSGTASRPSTMGLADHLGSLDYVAREVVQGRRDHRLHAEGERGRAAGQALRGVGGARGR